MLRRLVFRSAVGVGPPQAQGLKSRHQARPVEHLAQDIGQKHINNFKGTPTPLRILNHANTRFSVENRAFINSQ